MAASGIRAFNLAMSGSQAELSNLLSSGEVSASFTRQDGMYKGYSLLHAAASKGQTMVADLLLRAGADPGARNANGKTPSQLAMDKGHAGLAQALQQAEARGAQVPSLPLPQVAAAAPPRPSMPAAPSAPAPQARPLASNSYAAAAREPAHGSKEWWAKETERRLAAAGMPSQHPAAQPQHQGGFAPEGMDAQSYHTAPAAFQQAPPQPPPQPPPQLPPQPPPQQHYAPPQPPPQPPQPPPPQQPLFHPPPPQAPPTFAYQPQPAPPPLPQAAAPPQAAALTLPAAPPQPPPPAAPSPAAPPPPAPATPAAPIMSFAPPPTRAATAAATPPADDAAAAAANAVEALLQAHLSKVSEQGAYLAVLPSSALPALIGENQAHIQEMCARIGAQVDIGQEGSLMWVKITASAPRKAEQMLWEVLACTADEDACGAGFPLPPSGLAAAAPKLGSAAAAAGVAAAGGGAANGGGEKRELSDGVLQAVHSASFVRAIVQTSGCLLLSASSASMHAALLLLLRDALRTETSARKEVIAFTAFPRALERISSALKSRPSEEQHRARLMLPRAPGGDGAAPEAVGPRWAFLATDSLYVETAARLIGAALGGGGAGGGTSTSGGGGRLQSLQGKRMQLDPSLVSELGPPSAPPPPLPAALGGGGSQAENALAASLVGGADLTSAAASSSLTSLGPLSSGAAARLRAAALAHVRSRLIDGSSASTASEAVAWLDGAIASIDAACALSHVEASGKRGGGVGGEVAATAGPGGAAAAGAPCTKRHASEMSQSTAAAPPVLSFGGSASATPASASSPTAGAPTGSASTTAAASAAAATTEAALGGATGSAGDAAAGDEGSESSSYSDSESGSEASSEEERRRRKRKEKRRRKEKKERKRSHKEEKRSKRRKSEGGEQAA